MTEDKTADLFGKFKDLKNFDNVAENLLKVNTLISEHDQEKGSVKELKLLVLVKDYLMGSSNLIFKDNYDYKSQEVDIVKQEIQIMSDLIRKINAEKLDEVPAKHLIIKVRRFKTNMDHFFELQKMCKWIFVDEILFSYKETLEAMNDTNKKLSSLLERKVKIANKYEAVELSSTIDSIKVSTHCDSGSDTLEDVYLIVKSISTRI